MVRARSRARAVSAVTAGLLLVLAPRAYSQQGGIGTEPVTREEFAKFLEEYRQFKAETGKLRDENRELKDDLAEVRGELTALKREQGEVEFEQAAARERDELIERLDRIEEELDGGLSSLLPGLTNFTLGGFFSTRFDNRRGSDSTFGASLAPIILWKPTDELLFETRFDIFLAEHETAVDLAYAQLSYVLNDYLTVGGGKFVLPFGIFWERARAPWINKLPTMPLLYDRGLVGEAGLGAQIRGGAPIGPTKINYAAYVINGPEFRTNPSDLGRLGFGRSLDNNNNKAVGGRIGFLPIPELEIGSSILSGRVGSSGSGHGGADTLMLGVDLTYGREFDALKGRLDLRGEIVWVDSDDINPGSFLGLGSFTNQRTGWYLQAAYRPTQVDLKLLEKVELRNLEFVLRYDQLREPGFGALGIDSDQFTLGLNYWILPSVVLKGAYVFDDTHGAKDRDGFFLEMAAGF